MHIQTSPTNAKMMSMEIMIDNKNSHVYLIAYSFYQIVKGNKSNPHHKQVVKGLLKRRIDDSPFGLLTNKLQLK